LFYKAVVEIYIGRIRARNISCSARNKEKVASGPRISTSQLESCWPVAPSLY